MNRLTVVGRVTPCAPFRSHSPSSGAHGMTRPTLRFRESDLRFLPHIRARNWYGVAPLLPLPLNPAFVAASRQSAAVAIGRVWRRSAETPLRRGSRAQGAQKVRGILTRPRPSGGTLSPSEGEGRGEGTRFMGRRSLLLIQVARVDFSGASAFLWPMGADYAACPLASILLWCATISRRFWHATCRRHQRWRAKLLRAAEHGSAWPTSRPGDQSGAKSFALPTSSRATYFNPNGIASFSPRVARDELPWVGRRKGQQP